MKPMIILKPGQMSAEDRTLLNDNGVCVVEAEDPAAVRFVDPLPAVSSRNEIERAAIQLSRRIINWDFKDNFVYRETLTRLFCELISKGTPLDSAPTQEERGQAIFDRAKAEELQRLAREEARDERAAKKAAKQKSAQAK